MRRTAILLALASLLVLANVVMTSTGAIRAQANTAPTAGSAYYRLSWFTPLTGGGGGLASSPNYAMRFTVGQSVIGAMSAAGSEACLGYLCGTGAAHVVYLPLAIRGS